MGKKILFNTNPLEDHPMFSGATDAVEKKAEKLEVKKTAPRPAPGKEPLDFRKSTFYLTDDIHKGLKLYAVQNDIDISVLVRQVFVDFLKKKGVEI